MRKIISIVYSFNVSKSSVDNLDALAQEYLKLFKELFGNDDNKHKLITTKMHYLLHYRTLFHCFGPLILYSTKRYERYHQNIKRYTKLTKNFRNIALSVIKKLAKRRITIKRSKNICQKERKVTNWTMRCGQSDFELIKFEAQNVVEYQSIEQLQNINYYSIELELGKFYLFKKDNQLFFGKIIHLFKNINAIDDRNKYIIIIEKFDRSETENKNYPYSENNDIIKLLTEKGLNYRYYSYILKETNERIAVNIDDFRYPEALPYFKNNSGKYLIRKVCDFS